MTEHFSISELTCRCGCNQAPMDEAFMESLEALRVAYGKPMVISSGYRCPEYNSKIAKTGLSGPHTTGKAVDILVFGQEGFELLKHALALGFTGIGINQRGAYPSRFIHLDRIDSHKRPSVWSY